LHVVRRESVGTKVAKGRVEVFMSSVQKSVTCCYVLIGAMLAGCGGSDSLVAPLAPVDNSGFSGRVELRDSLGGKTLSPVIESWVKLEGIGLDSAVLKGSLYSGTCDALGAIILGNAPAEINRMTPPGVYGNKEEQPEFQGLISGELASFRGGKFAFVVYVSNSKRPVACADIL
jgi:hypothetical protein